MGRLRIIIITANLRILFIHIQNIRKTSLMNAPTDLKRISIRFHKMGKVLWLLFYFFKYFISNQFSEIEMWSFVDVKAQVRFDIFAALKFYINLHIFYATHDLCRVKYQKAEELCGSDESFPALFELTNWWIGLKSQSGLISLMAAVAFVSSMIKLETIHGS